MLGLNYHFGLDHATAPPHRWNYGHHAGRPETDQQRKTQLVYKVNYDNIPPLTGDCSFKYSSVVLLRPLQISSPQRHTSINPLHLLSNKKLLVHVFTTKMALVVLITGAGSGFGLLAARTLANAGHIVYGGIHTVHQANDEETSQMKTVHTVVLDITNKDSIDSAVAKILGEAGRIDCLIHNAGHMGMGPAEAFSAAQFHDYYEINTVGAHRLNQAVLPLMRKAGRGHIIWVSSSSSRGGSGPLLAPYFAAKAAMHSLALTLSTEIACWGIETTIIVPGKTHHSVSTFFTP